jgi:hypothetical protein
MARRNFYGLNSTWLAMSVSCFPPSMMRRLPSAPRSFAVFALGERKAREGIKQRQLGARLRQHDSPTALSLPGSVGETRCTSHPKGTTDWMRLGSTILTSDSPAKNVMIRMLERAVLTAT